ncbi:T6SS immunity protein Tdi1 domain-containing protein [Pleionea litopenaei]|uniref:DUF1851 domain-containing protein n=1 Tax=Pleionea litopenaei TaxID=3070815 RepID=A0AA51RS98_9GAMM|nr:T6SS immunity protein Tdi1 domain-containing protein [Pleionea sp. HL-JVS1]WMS86579.1 DUF1851 domain-containing protein [Pleionea sp. HL-JVS1]
MKILDEIKKSWGWTGLIPVEVVAENEFANFILKDAKGRFWRLCPEDVYCEVIANDTSEYNELVKDEEFSIDWFMEKMVNEAKENLGELPDGMKYHMTIPGPLGGEYGGSNLKIVSTLEIIRYSGSLGYQTKDLAQGEIFEFKVID